MNYDKTILISGFETRYEELIMQILQGVFNIHLGQIPCLISA